MTAGTDGFDVVVVGGGMIGAAATRHAAEAGLAVALVAAPEPDDWASSSGPFASHYDEGRITRIIDADPVWSELAAASLARHPDLTTRTGIEFHDPVGLVWVRPAGIARTAVADAVARGADAEEVTATAIHDHYGIAVPDLAGKGCIHEGPPAGLINPRRLVRAQLAAAASAGATIVAAAATSVTPSPEAAVVHGSFGEIHGRAVLLATGAYGASTVGVGLAMERWPRTTVRLEIEHDQRLPSLIVDGVATPDIEGIYWVPPVRYPNGKVMLKIGGVHASTEPFPSVDRIADWFRGSGSTVEAASLRAVVHELLPTAEVVSWDTVPCVITNTTTGYPYVGWVDERIAVAVGGNGAAAKSSDEIGRRAASLFAGQDSDEADLSPFRPVVQSR